MTHPRTIGRPTGAVDWLAVGRIGLGIIILITAATQHWYTAWWLFFVGAMAGLVEDALARTRHAQPDHQVGKAGDLALGLGSWIGLTAGGELPWWLLIYPVAACMAAEIACDTFGGWRGLLSLALTGGGVLAAVFGWRLFNMAYGDGLFMTVLAVFALVGYLTVKFRLRRRPLPRSRHLPV